MTNLKEAKKIIIHFHGKYVSQSHLDIDPRHVPLAAAHAPAHNTRQLPHPAHLADQGPAPVTCETKMCVESIRILGPK